MEKNCFTIQPDGHLEPQDEAAALEAWRARTHPVWIDFGDVEEAQVSAWLDRLNLDPELLDMLHTGGLNNKILPTARAVYFACPMVLDRGRERPINFACLCLEGLVVTMQDQSVEIPGLSELMVKHYKIATPSTSGLVCAVVIYQSLALRQMALELRDQSRSYAENMDQDPESVSLEEILSLKKEVMQLDGVVDEEMAVFDLLQNLHYPALDLVSVKDNFQIAVSNTHSADRSLDRLDRSVIDLQDRYGAIQQDKTNSRLNVLTIISAIFSPLTLVAGIWGMNFVNMPELQLQNAYFYALGGMAVTAGLLFWYFRSRGWLN